MSYPLKTALLFICCLLLNIPLNATIGRLGTPAMPHNQTFGDFLDYTTWDFGSYQKPRSSKFQGYSYNDKLDDHKSHLQFFPERVEPRFDRRRIIPLFVAQASVKKVNDFFAKPLNNSAEESAPPEPKPTLKKEKHIVSSAGGPSTVAYENPRSSTNSQSYSPKPVPIAPEDILLLLKKKAISSPNSSSEISIPFEIPYNNNYQRPIPSQAMYTQE